jgi:hypothetical protein
MHSLFFVLRVALQQHSTMTNNDKQLCFCQILGDWEKTGDILLTIDKNEKVLRRQDD